MGEKVKKTRIWFDGEKKPYKIQALSPRYAICTKPFNLKRTVLYTIVDFAKNIRGPENLIFCMGFETEKRCEEALIRLQKGESEISHRNRVSLNIRRVD